MCVSLLLPGHTWADSMPADRFPPREDLPLPTQPPYTAFVGNLSFDLTDHEFEGFFADCKVRRVSPCLTKDYRSLTL